MSLWHLLTSLLDYEQSDYWDAVSAIGTALSAVIAFMGLVFLGVQIRQANKISDVQSLKEFLRSVTEHENDIRSADGEEEREDAFNSYLNFLEVHAAALHGGLFSRVTKEFVREKIRDSIAVIEAIGEWSEKLMKAKTSPTTFKHLFRFMKKERRQIERVKGDLLSELQVPTADPGTTS